MYDRIHGAGAEVVAISVDDDARQAGMAQRWGFTHTRFVSDPGGETHLQPLGLFDPEDRGGIALPGMLIFSPDGEEVYRYESRDFADRTRDDELVEALTALGLDAVDPEAWAGDADVPDDLRGYFRPTDYTAVFRGNFFGAIAIGRRVADDESRAIAKEHRIMSQANIDAWDHWRKR
jgi:hypothetical protein